MSESTDSYDVVPLLEAQDITRRFGDLLANDGIDLMLERGRIHALLGENGAGKSTLVKILYGLLQPTSGSIQFEGQTIRLAGPAEARRLGIGMVFQHFSLFDNLTVAENIALASETAADLARIADEVATLSGQYGLPLDPRREVWRLSVGERQRIEIIRALMQQPKLLILDEPTSVLTPQEAERLFETLERLKAEGVAILYISHKLDEVKRLCERATILRHGRVVGSCDPRRETSASMARQMVGAEIPPVARQNSPRGAVRFSCHRLDLPSADPHGVSLHRINLELHGGRILGVAGVAGNGQDELFAALSGECPVAAATIKLEGRDVGRFGPDARRRLGAAFVPEERLGHATAPAMTLSENVLLTAHATGDLVKGGLVRVGRTLALVDRISKAFDIRKSGRDPVAGSLSGGNLQKFIVGREILRKPGVLIVSQPTWGVDAGAAALIRQSLIDLARSGTAVLVISQDLDELLELADSIAVMHAGRLTPDLPREDWTREAIGLAMTGATAEAA